MSVVLFLICAFILLWLYSVVGEYRDRGNRIKQQTAEIDKLYSTNKKLEDKLKEMTSKLSEAASSYRELYKRLKLVEANEELLRKTVQEAPAEIDKLYSTNKKLEDKLKEMTSKLSEAASSYRELYKRLKLVESNEELLRKTLQEAPLGFPSLLQAIKIYDERVDEAAVQWLRNKPHPALNAAEMVKKETSKRREAEYECRQAKLLMEYYFNIFPDIEERKEILSENIDDIEKTSADDEEDVSRRYLSDDEYRSLSDTDRNQLALTRFWKRHKSKRLIGKLYEQYIGYLYEEKGYHVEYFGILKGLEDLGRDLICKNDEETLLIQCKNWSNSKTIYEKHIFQLLGTAYQYAKTNPMENVTMAFYTTTHLSDIARSFAKDFKIKLYENFPLQQPFPIIKCNVNKNGERIYHLPFDQQYDTTKIRIKEGDFYCETVAEAEKAGFRRAYRWHGAEL